jgi:SAM-dependent methyltransferase
MSQNIYDDDAFFAGYSKLRRSVEGLAGAPEWPALRAMLPPLAGAHVLDLGCGFGWFCRFAAGEGAAEILGVDLSENMLAEARIAGGPIAYTRADLETLPIAPGAWDVIYSSLTLHYIADLAGLIGRIAAGLRPGGRFVASVEHPIFTAPTAPGWHSTDGQQSWKLNAYLCEGPRTTNWFAPGVIKQHRTTGTYTTLLLQSGLTLTHLEEWGPSPAQIAETPAWAAERDRPPFLLLAARK